ncbi:hypothetical protein PMKS-002242 [Pichia membranifaciens]|uniref:Sorting nexin-4 n=1 Tax=Pichia membranifaciens TaxID=4926 RepID=A0A1Q2YGT5_9ASCO|nr:hypothetical protein PMKS-002242 [Pichia membranifaciens]
MTDEFSSIQWDNKNSVQDITGSTDEHSVDAEPTENSADIKAGEETNMNGEEGSTIAQLQNKSTSTLPNESHDDPDDKYLEGSGLITQTMILGAQEDDQDANKNKTIFQGEQETADTTANSTNNMSMSTEVDNASNANANTSVNANQMKPSDVRYKLEISVNNPVVEHEGSASFTIYHINIETNNPRLTKSKYTVVRRYSDFDILHQCLSFDHPTLLIPPLPNKQRLEYIKGGRFTDEFVSKRCNSLDIFINRVIKHPVLSKSEVLMIFLEDSDYWSTYKSNLHLNESNSIVHSNPSVEGVTDFLMNSFKKPHVESKYSKNFKEIDHQRLNLQDNLNKVDRIYSKVVNKQDSISRELNSFGDEFNKLTILLNNDFNGKYREENQLDDETKVLVSEFRTFSENLKKSGSYYNDLNQFIEFKYLNNLKDLEHYLIALGNLIKLKDYKVLDYEMLNNYLEKATAERENLIRGGSLTSTTEGTISFLSKKLESLTGLRGSSLLPSSASSASTTNSRNVPASIGTGTDSSAATDISNTSVLVNERIEKLNSRISLLEREKVQAKQVYEQFEKDLVDEWSQFQKIKDDEISQSLNELSEEYTRLYSKSYDDWNAFKLNKEGIKLQNKLDDDARDKYFSANAVIKNDEEIKELLQEMEI